MGKRPKVFGYGIYGFDTVRNYDIALEEGVLWRWNIDLPTVPNSDDQRGISVRIREVELRRGTRSRSICRGLAKGYVRMNLKHRLRRDFKVRRGENFGPICTLKLHPCFGSAPALSLKLGLDIDQCPVPSIQLRPRQLHPGSELYEYPSY